MTQETEEKVDWRKLPRSPHISGWRKQKLIQECARGELTNARLARDYNVTEGSIAAFKVRHSDEINEIINGLSEDYERVWFAQQYNRVIFLAGLIEGYEDRKDAMLAEAERLTNKLRQLAEEAGEPYEGEEHPPVKEWDTLCKSQAMYAKQLAEELGQLKQRAPASETANMVRVIHEVGVDYAKAFPAKEPV